MIRLANKSDLPKIMNIIDSIKIEMQENNNSQWGSNEENYPDISIFTLDINSKSLYIFEEHNVVKGIITIVDENNDYEGLIKTLPLKSYVIHRLAVDKKYRHQKIAQKLLRFAENLAIENNIEMLKSDTEQNNNSMNRLFEYFGYEKKGEFEYSDYPGHYNYYEKKIYLYDVIVVGGGHAGCEAANIAAKMGMKTLLLTMNKENIADMPCNPSIGGTAKGVIVREIDALGGLMGKVADLSHFQIKMLNNSKGPAVRSLRAQADKRVYPKKMLEFLEKNSNLTIKEGMVENLIVKDNEVLGVILENKEEYRSKTVILTTGTYLKANILVGSENTPSGPHGERRSNHLSDNLKQNGLKIIRLKTGTPQRIKKDSIDFSVMQEEFGDNCYWTFSYDLKPQYKINEQQRCYLIYTNELTDQIIREHLKESAMYGGYATGVGPRYCPSIEDKVVRFADKSRHQLFLEPESIYYDEWYLQGFSTSMPRYVQEEMVHSLKGLEHAEIVKYAYAIEYDAIDALQIKPSLENKILKNLFTAGQINGTSGYEEAAGQGIIAGINAALKTQNKEPLILRRDEAYIGVLIDDLVTKGVTDPYRMLTSRAEFRLLLRHDNADLRLREKAHNIGCIDEEQYKRYLDKVSNIEKLFKEVASNKIIMNEEIKNCFQNNNLEVPKYNMTYEELLKRPEITFAFLKQFHEFNYDEDVLEQVEIELKYNGYIKKAYKEAEKLQKIEEKEIPDDIDYQKIKNLASEAKQKLELVRPKTIAQATRISGVNPADIAVISVYLKKEYNKNE